MSASLAEGAAIQEAEARRRQEVEGKLKQEAAVKLQQEAEAKRQQELEAKIKLDTASKSQPAVQHPAYIAPPVYPRKKTPFDDLAPMPNGWGFGVDSQSRVYFKHHETKQTTWQDPRLLPAGYDQRLDSQGRLHFGNSLCKATTWIDPRGLPDGWSMEIEVGVKQAIFVESTHGFRTRVDPRGVPPGYSMHVMDATGKVYFKVHAERRTQWEDPRMRLSAAQLAECCAAELAAWYLAKTQTFLADASKAKPLVEDKKASEAPVVVKSESPAVVNPVALVVEKQQVAAAVSEIASVPLSAPANAVVGAVLVPAECNDEDSNSAAYGPAMPSLLSLSPSSSVDSSSDFSSSSSNLQNLAARLVDADASLFEAGLSPVQGIATAEQLPFADAVKRCGVKGMALNIKCAAKHGATMKNHGAGGALTADHIAAIHMYTQNCDFYRMLNACLRNRDRDTIKPFFSYLRLLLEALRLLPAQKRVVYRGVKLDLSAKFRKGDEPVWWSVTSTSTTMEVLQSKEFCGQEGPRTVFVVQASHARDIAAFSAFASEEELILLPGAQLAVKAVVPMGGGLHLVQMDEVDDPMSLVEFEDDE
jgi:hypothetical protein